jgi:hypothetical protein
MFKILTIPFDRKKKGFDEDLLNRFIVNKRLTACRSEFFREGGHKRWIT